MTTPDPTLVQAARALADRMWRLARMMADPATIWTPGQAEAEMADIHQEIAAFGAAQRAAEREHVEQLRAALMEHACIEKPERGFTKERYPNHSCWAALRAARPEGT